MKQYATIAQKIQYAINDTEVFHLTGCLSKCDKYDYVSHPRTELREKDLNTPGPSFQISFRIPNGQNEVKEQVENTSSVNKTAVCFEFRYLLLFLVLAV